MSAALYSTQPSLCTEGKIKSLHCQLLQMLLLLLQRTWPAPAHPQLCTPPALMTAVHLSDNQFMVSERSIIVNRAV